MDSLCKVCVPQPNINICSKDDTGTNDAKSDFDRLSKEDKELFYKISSIGRYGNVKNTINKTLLQKILNKSFDQPYENPCKLTAPITNEDVESANNASSEMDVSGDATVSMNKNFN